MTVKQMMVTLELHAKMEAHAQLTVELDAKVMKEDH